MQSGFSVESPLVDGEMRCHACRYAFEPATISLYMTLLQLDLR